MITWTMWWGKRHGKGKTKEGKTQQFQEKKKAFLRHVKTHMQKHTEHQRLSVYSWRKATVLLHLFLWPWSRSLPRNEGGRPLRPQPPLDWPLPPLRQTRQSHESWLDDWAKEWSTQVPGDANRPWVRVVDWPPWDRAEHGSSLDWKSKDPQHSLHEHWKLWQVTQSWIIFQSSRRAIPQYFLSFVTLKSLKTVQL